MSGRTRGNDDAAYAELGADAWHQTDEGTYYVDCPECGSAATLANVFVHGRCNGYLDRRQRETDLDEEAMECTARLWFELGYVSEPDGSDADDRSTEGESNGHENRDETRDRSDPTDRSTASGSPAGANGTVDDG